MKPKNLLDSFALLSYLGREKGFEPVRDALSDAQRRECSLLMNEINVGETYYILFRKRGRQEAEYFLDSILTGLPISVVPNVFGDVIAAARIKAEYPLSYADCFAVATARRENAAFLTGDPEFKCVEHLISIVWLS